MRFVVIIDNEKGFRLEGEHGLSVYIEKDDYSFLFDTGQTDLILENACKCGINLKNIKSIVLSHRHYDHTGGLKYLLRKNQNVTIYAGVGIEKPVYSFKEGEWIYKGIPIKIPQSRWIKIIKKQRLTESIYLISSIIRYEKRNTADSKFSQYPYSASFPGFDEEIVALVKSGKGWILFTGCSHAGILNIVKYVKNEGFENLYAVVGGFHFVNYSEKLIEEVSRKLLEEVEVMYPGHCTGEKGKSILKKLGKERVFPLYSGREVWIE